MPDSFFDSNILLYLLSGDERKASLAERTVAKGGIISIQVLNEVASVARRKFGLNWSEVHDFLSKIRMLLPVQPLTLETHEAGLTICERYRLKIYDAMILGSALHAGCDRIWSEDMQNGQLIDNRLLIENPFRMD